MVEVETAFKELIEKGFHIEQVEADAFMVYDNGKFGFVSEEDPFIVDGEGVLEIYEMYL
jgi:DNA-binding helix-hairpin-helix protein with protein kinase domain